MELNSTYLTPAELTSLSFNIGVLVLFVERLIRKTPRNFKYYSWNKPKQYEFIAFIAVIINQTCYFVLVLFRKYPLVRQEDGSIDSLGLLGIWKYLAITCMWIMISSMVLGSLYRYERLLTVTRGTKRYRVIQILKITMITLATLATIVYVWWRLIPRDNATLKSILWCVRVALDTIGMNFAGFVDLTSNIIMTKAVLYSLPRRINEPIRFARFKRKLALLPRYRSRIYICFRRVLHSPRAQYLYYPNFRSYKLDLHLPRICERLLTLDLVLLARDPQGIHFEWRR